MVTFRSEPMGHGCLVLPKDTAYNVIDRLAREINIQFVDSNAHLMARPYKRFIQRLDEMERILRLLLDEVEKIPHAYIEKGHNEAFLEHAKEYTLDSVEAQLTKLNGSLAEFKANDSTLATELDSLQGELAVAGAAEGILRAEDRAPELHTVTSLAAVAVGSAQAKIARGVHRATRGNAYTVFSPVPFASEPPPRHESRRRRQKREEEEAQRRKTVCVVYVQGGMNSVIHDKIVKVFTTYGAGTYTWPYSKAAAKQRAEELNEEIEAKKLAAAGFQEFFLQEIAMLLGVPYDGGNALLEEWRLFALKEKAIFAVLDMFEVSGETMRTDVWYPKSEESRLKDLLHAQRDTEAASFLLVYNEAKAQPPTYFRTTEFTDAFQTFVDTYGIARYQEVNPAYLTCVTFPFLFGIMYGDVGHGTFILISGIFLLILNGLGKNSALLGARYMLTLMGIFAVYAGFMYNDYFSLGMDIFGTRYVVNSTRSVKAIRILLQDVDTLSGPLRTLQSTVPPTETYWDPCPISCAGDSGCLSHCPTFPYPCGIDPIWKGATNELLFFNSFKMKFAIIVAFVQMMTGTMLKGVNNVYFRDWLSFVFEFIPQVLLFASLIGYMAFLIVYKWLMNPEAFKAEHGEDLPSIITTMINMFMFKKETALYPAQFTVQPILVIIVVVCVPVMLLPKPIILKLKHGKKAKKEKQPLKDVENPDGPEGESEGEEFNFGEEMIHQVIETIEFVLGSISNTASYLRLWALSLAHQQLALVFYSNTVELILDMSMSGAVKGILLFFVFAIFAMVTCGVLLMMDSLECFLHALRLQWVEFQSKFFKADGYKFQAFKYEEALKGAEEK